MKTISRFLSLCAFAASLVAVNPAAAQQAVPTAPPPPPDASPFNVVMHIDFVPRRAPEGLIALHQYELDSRKDDGNARVEVLQELAQPNHFIVEEVWRNRAAFDAHLGAPHTRSFRDAIQGLIGSPFDVRLTRLAPATYG
jgi:quinol monooxygenase YgiN